MKRINIIFGAIIISLSLIGCSSVTKEQVQVIVNDKIDETKNKAIDELKKAFVDQVQEFVKNSDLQKTFGLSDDEQNIISESLRESLEEYDCDPSQIKKAIDELTKSMEGMKEKGSDTKLTVDEINKKIQEYIKQDK